MWIQKSNFYMKLNEFFFINEKFSIRISLELWIFSKRYLVIKYFVKLIMHLKNHKSVRDPRELLAPIGYIYNCENYIHCRIGNPLSFIYIERINLILSLFCTWYTDGITYFLSLPKKSYTYTWSSDTRLIRYRRVMLLLFDCNYCIYLAFEISIFL